MTSDLPANPRCIVVIDGHRFDSFDPETIVERFESVSVELSTDRSSMAKWKVFDPDFRISDKFAYIAGGGLPSVAIYLGYGNTLGKPIFEGVVTKINRTDTATGFVAYDNGFKMKRVKIGDYFYKKDDKDIIGILAARNGLGFSPPDAKGLEKYRVMTQDQKNDWEMTLERAREMGWVVYVRGNTLFARYPARVTVPIATFINRKDFRLKHGFEFEFRVPESQEGKRKVNRVGRGKGGKRLVGESDISARGKENVNLKRDTPGKHTKTKLEIRAQAQKDLEREHAFEAHLSAVVAPYGARIDVRDSIRIMEVGKLFSGVYICDGVRYNFRPGTMELDLDLYRDALPKNSDQQGSDFLGG
ncbi:MAG: hypothetical protein M3209_00205 [Acidobacteriota bacterium]|nr:hypothetical protein [Acidobacteriota bacterium]